MRDMKMQQSVIGYISTTFYSLFRNLCETRGQTVDAMKDEQQRDRCSVLFYSF